MVVDSWSRIHVVILWQLTTAIMQFVFIYDSLCSPSFSGSHRACLALHPRALETHQECRAKRSGHFAWIEEQQLGLEVGIGQSNRIID